MPNDLDENIEVRSTVSNNMHHIYGPRHLKGSSLRHYPSQGVLALTSTLLQQAVHVTRFSVSYPPIFILIRSC
jgi:hypothetical protein